MTENSKRAGKLAAAKVNTTVDLMANTDFSENLDACVVQASRFDREAAPSGPGAVERVWMMSRPPKMCRGVEPTVTARRAYVWLTHIQGQMIDTEEIVCTKVCGKKIATKGGKDKDKETG